VSDPQPNYDYSGIGRAEALLLFSALAASPWAVLTNGFLGSIVFWILTKICTGLANKEVMVLNVGATTLQTIMQKGEFDATLDAAFKAIKGNPDRLSAAEKAKIDDPVIAAFRKFAVFGQLRNSGDSGTAPGDNPTGFGRRTPS